MTGQIRELEILTALLDSLRNSTGSENALISIVSQYQAISGNSEATAVDFYKFLAGFSNLVETSFLEGGSRRIARNAYNRISTLFGARHLARSIGDYSQGFRSEIEFALDMLPIFENLYFDTSVFIEKRPEIEKQLEHLDELVGGSDALSEASKAVVKAQLALIRRSLGRFEIEGVGPFRDSIFSAVGRIHIELKDEVDVELEGIKIADWILRIYGLMEIGGRLLALTAPDVVPQLLLTGPAT